MSPYFSWQTVSCTKSNNFHPQAIAAADIHKTALSLVWLTHWPRGPRVNVWESRFPAEGYDLGWTSSWMLSKSFCWNDCRNKQSPYIHCDPTDQTRLQQLLCIPTSVKSVQLIQTDFCFQAVLHHNLLCGSCCYYLLLLWCWSADGIWILEPRLQFFDQILRSRDPFSFWWDIEVLFLPTRWNWNSSFRNVCQSFCLLANFEPNAVFHPNHHVWFP